MYEFASKELRFSEGGLDELLALDRYAVSTHDFNEINVGDIVVVIVDKNKDIRKVGKVVHKDDNTVKIETRDGDKITVDAELVAKPLELTPQQLWSRWARAAASVENEKLRAKIENQLRRLFDGYRYSPGGRIQLGLGQEYVTGIKAPLTLYNCFVLPNPKGSADGREQFTNVLQSALEEIHIMRRGGGVGFNLSEIQTVNGVGQTKIGLYLPVDHKDYDELQDKIRIGKFDHVRIVTDIKQARGTIIKVEDSVEGLVEAMIQMVELAYKGQEFTLDFSDVRHRRAIVKGVNGRSSGAVSWMELFDLIVSLLQQEQVDAIDFAEVFSTVTNLIEQGGSRRGALMLILEDYRRDILDKFITRKRTPGKLTGANVSVGVSDEFMENLERGAKEETRLWNEIIESAWASAEPGVIFLTRCNKESNSWYFNPLVATNPLANVAVGM